MDTGGSVSQVPEERVQLGLRRSLILSGDNDYFTPNAFYVETVLVWYESPSLAPIFRAKIETVLDLLRVGY